MTFEKEYILRCATAEWIARNGCALRWCHRAVGRKIEETVGFPEWNVQFSVWLTTGKNSSEPWAIVCQNCAIYSVFTSGMTSHSKIDQLDWDCISALRKIWKMQWNFTHGCTTCVTKLDIFSIRNTYMLNTSKYNSAKRLLAPVYRSAMWPTLNICTIFTVFLHSFTMRLDIIRSLYVQMNAQLDCSKKF